MSGQIMWGKWMAMSGLIMVGGWGVMRLTTQSEDQLYKKLAPDLQRKVDEIRRQREGKTGLQEQLSDASGQDQVVWAEQLAPSAGRRV